jgi:hypothetical protein
LFPSQAAFDHRCAGGTIERKPAQDAPHKLQRSISQRREASLRRLLVKCRLSAGQICGMDTGSLRGKAARFGRKNLCF